jgi:hypothetical protein
MHLEDLLGQIIGLPSKLQRPNPPNSLFSVKCAGLAPDQGQAAAEAAAIAISLFIVRHGWISDFAEMALCLSGRRRNNHMLLGSLVCVKLSSSR